MTAKDHSTSDSPILQDIPSRRPSMGEWCSITAIAEKRHPYKEGVYTTEWREKTLGTPIKAMYVGFRVVYDGRTHWGTVDSEGYQDEPNQFEQTKSHYVWVFIKNERSNPIYVYVRNVRRLGGAE